MCQRGDTPPELYTLGLVCHLLSSLIVRVVLFEVLADVEVAQFVRVLIRRNYSHPISQVLLLEELFGQILQIALRELLCRLHRDLRLVARNSNHIAKVSSLVVDLDTLVEKLFLNSTTGQRRMVSTLRDNLHARTLPLMSTYEYHDIHDLVVTWRRTINNKLSADLARLAFL